MASPFSKPEANPDRLFAAVGHAISVWESSVEMGMARLYSVMERRPFELDAYAEFGSGARVSSARVHLLNETGKKHFFAAMSDESNERAFGELIADLRLLSAVRHQVAHGTIWTLPVLDATGAQPGDWIVPRGVGHYWTAPRYATNTLRVGDTAYLFNASDIDEAAAKFAAAGRRLAEMANRLAP